MKITDIKVFPVHEEKLKAFISIVLDECFMVNDIKVIQGKEGFFISMPSRRKRNGKFKDVAHPLNNETRQSMEREILAAYEGTLDGAEEQPIKVKARPTGAGEGEGRKPRRKAKRARPRAGAGGGGPVEREKDVPSSPRPRREKPFGGPAESRGTAAAPAAPEATESPVADTSDETASTDTEQEHTDKSPDEVAEHHLRDSFWGT